MIISVLLRTGVMISALVVLLGGICFLSKHGHEQPEYRVFHGTRRHLSQYFGRGPCRRDHPTVRTSSSLGCYC